MPAAPPPLPRAHPTLKNWTLRNRCIAVPTNPHHGSMDRQDEQGKGQFLLHSREERGGRALPRSSSKHSCVSSSPHPLRELQPPGKKCSHTPPTCWRWRRGQLSLGITDIQGTPSLPAPLWFSKFWIPIPTIGNLGWPVAPAEQNPDLSTVKSVFHFYCSGTPAPQPRDGAPRW